ncbi:hypothetical protein EPUS_01705 [Endocarpon pusillum Z07020]|uniref:SH3 domain-containing protein n=1 Tax=Endocarpon pusillum (strain Z07020 / HMAS-L-300199) TaxID=1263415 RepID=U1HN65_ENDPU|nr:uncharacterized protein EPUS_01705 [Endocarpon pusillum Z07020]ERF71790.1 hypothetical protein EPUS_01705 [Endocarpon pusillum Z07020]
MPSRIASSSDVPTVPLSFSNNFWGRDDAGVGPLLDRMHNAKITCDELKAFYNARAALEDEYAKKLFALSRKPLGSGESGTLRASLDVLRGEVENTGKSHATIAQQMKSELEEPLGAFAGGMKERRKIIQTGIERLLKTKQTQTAHVNKTRDRYEQDCLRIKGYLAQGHMVMGQEERKNKAKLEKTQINMASNSNEYESSVKVLEETTGRWNKEWKAACDKFQDLEEERLDFTKASLWSFANIASTVCVSDDASCEKIRLALENCEVEKDILSFIKERGTGQEIPDPPRYINFCRGDLNDTASEASEDEKYSVAQFPRTVNPAFRSASPNPSTYESHHDPNSELAQQMGHPAPPESLADDNDLTPLKTNSGRPRPLNYRQPEQNMPPNYSPSQHGDVTNVPHNEYPTEGMTMFCRTGPPSVTGSGLSNNTRPSSRDSQSDYSNPTSYTTADPLSGKNSPTKCMPPVNSAPMAGMSNVSPDKTVQKRRSGFFSNSPFRRKSKKELDHTAHTLTTDRSNRNTWAPQSGMRTNNASSTNINSTSSSPTKSFGRNNIFNRNQAPPEGEERADPRATFQLNVGNNVFDVASPDHQTTPKARKGFSPPVSSGEDVTTDPLKQALMELQQGGGAGMGKQSSTRVTADRYHGIKTPAPDATAARPPPLSAASADKIGAQRGTPPPAYEGARGGPPLALGVPQPAFTSKEMRKRTETWGSGSQAGYPSGRNAQAGRPGTRDGNMQRSRSPGLGMGGLPRAASPQPIVRARSPGPDMMRSRSPAPPMNPNIRARSPAPPLNPNMRARSPAPPMNPNMRAKSPVPPMMMSGQSQYRAPSPNPYAGSRDSQSRQNAGMEMQLSSQDVQRYDASGSGRSRHSMMDRGGRPGSAYSGDPYAQQQGGRGMDPQMRRERSKSMAPAPAMGGMGGSSTLHYARALYSYTAAIPEELSFSKGDVLAVLRLQDDGWWEAQIEKGRQGVGMVGLVPSNYLQRC